MVIANTLEYLSRAIIIVLIRHYGIINLANLPHFCGTLKRLQRRQHYRKISHEDWVLYSVLIIQIKL